MHVYRAKPTVAISYRKLYLGYLLINMRHDFQDLQYNCILSKCEYLFVGEEHDHRFEHKDLMDHIAHLAAYQA